MTETLSPTRTLTPTAGPLCGNGSASGLEECDDGNLVSGDGCSSSCQLEEGGDPCAGVAASSSSTLDSIRITNAVTRPVAIASDRRDPRRVYVVEAGGSIALIKDGALVASRFLQLPAGRVATGNEQGLLGLAFHPDYEDNGLFFVSYTEADGDVVVSRFQRSPLDPDDALENSEVVLLNTDQPNSNHNGGNLAFGPDGYLYIGKGDGGGSGDPGDNAQNDASLLGKMLRMDVDNPSPPRHYGIPASNPNGNTDFPLDLIWAKGLRNPWRYSFDRETGDLYSGDVGQSEREEVSVQPVSSMGGENYGWDVFEGTFCHEGPCPNPPIGFTLPVYEYDHDTGTPTGCSITGGFVYRGCAMTSFQGKYFFSDFCTSFVRSFEWSIGSGATNHEVWTSDLAPGGGLSINNISSFGEDARGELYIADIGGEIYKVVPGM